MDPSLTDNLGVETFHKIIEDEFYECEKFNNQDEASLKVMLIYCSSTIDEREYQQKQQSFYQLLKEKQPDLCNKILNLPPIRSERLGKKRE